MRAADRPILLDLLSVEGCHLPPDRCRATRRHLRLDLPRSGSGVPGHLPVGDTQSICLEVARWDPVVVLAFAARTDFQFGTKPLLRRFAGRCRGWRRSRG